MYDSKFSNQIFSLVYLIVYLSSERNFSQLIYLKQILL